MEIAVRQSAKEQKSIPTVSVKEDDFNIELPIDEIDYIESDRNYLLFHTINKVYKNRSTIGQILEILPGDTFIQVHRADVVNKTKIGKVLTNTRLFLQFNL